MAEEENIIEKFKSKEFGFNGKGSIVRCIIGDNVFIVKDNSDGTYNFIKISKSDYDNFYKNEKLKENNDVSKAIIDYIEFDQTFFNKNKDKFIKSLNDQQLNFDDVKQMTSEKFKSLKVSSAKSENFNVIKPEPIPEPIPEKKDEEELMGDDDEEEEEKPIQEEKKDDGKKPIKEEKGQPTLSKEDKELFRTFKDKYKFELKNENAGFAFTRVGDDIIFVRKIGTNKKGFAQYKDGPYLILKTNAKKFKKFKDNEVAKKEKEEAEGMADDDEEEEKEKKDDNIFFEYFNFSNDYFKDNEKKFADSLKKKKFLFDNLDDKEKKDVNYFGWNEFKDLDIIPGIKVKDTYKDRLRKFNVNNIQDNIFIKKEEAKEKEKDLFGIENEEPIQENEPLPKEEDIEIEDDIYNTDSERMTDSDDDVPEINLQALRQQQQQRKQKRQRKQLIQSQNNQLIAGHTPNGEELRALIKYNNNSDSLLKLIVSLSENNKGEVDFKEIGEIQDLNGDITNLYSKMQDLKSKINSSNNAEEKERLLIKYNEKRLKLEDLIKKYSKEAYRLSTLNKKKKATYSNPNYIKNKLSKL